MDKIGQVSEQFQSTPPRGGRQQSGVLEYIPVEVSIHAPARGATFFPLNTKSAKAMFQSTPPRGGRRHYPTVKFFGKLFQSTPPRGGRPLLRAHAANSAGVSIHAPARGATISTAAWPRDWTKFQSTPPRGGRRVDVDGCPSDYGFQSTPPRGGRRLPIPPKTPPRCFNPRPRAGGDAQDMPRLSRTPCFNPRPRAGGDA